MNALKIMRNNLLRAGVPAVRANGTWLFGTISCDVVPYDFKNQKFNYNIIYL